MDPRRQVPFPAADSADAFDLRQVSGTRLQRRLGLPTCPDVPPDEDVHGNRRQQRERKTPRGDGERDGNNGPETDLRQVPEDLAAVDLAGDTKPDVEGRHARLEGHHRRHDDVRDDVHRHSGDQDRDLRGRSVERPVAETDAGGPQHERRGGGDERHLGGVEDGLDPVVVPNGVDEERSGGPHEHRHAGREEEDRRDQHARVEHQLSLEREGQRSKGRDDDQAGTRECDDDFR